MSDQDLMSVIQNMAKLRRDANRRGLQMKVVITSNEVDRYLRINPAFTFGPNEELIESPVHSQFIGLTVLPCPYLRFDFGIAFSDENYAREFRHDLEVLASLGMDWQFILLKSEFRNGNQRSADRSAG